MPPYRECVKNSDCDSGYCSSNKCVEKLGPFTPCNPESNQHFCRDDLNCDKDAWRCVRNDWSADPGHCRRDADCGKGGWCRDSDHTCFDYMLVGGECGKKDERCDPGEAVCFGGFCREKCDTNGSSECQDSGNQCTKVAAFDRYDVCLPPGLAIEDSSDKPRNPQIVKEIPASNTDEPASATSKDDASHLPWVLGIGGALVLVSVIAGLYFYYQQSKNKKPSSSHSI